MKIVGASFVETLDTKGTDGSNPHLGGPATITGYFGGIGQPNGHALQWLDEFLYYYTNYGVQDVLNFNAGTILLGFLLYRLGVDIHFKISVFFGSDNPYHALWIMMAAKLFSRADGSTPLVGFNWSNSTDNGTIEIAAQSRKALGFEHAIRFEHHITETYRSIVLQPYDRRSELLDIAGRVANVFNLNGPNFTVDAACAASLAAIAQAVNGLRLREFDMAVTGGIATPEDGIKAILSGADAVQMVSALLRHGSGYIQTMREGLERWMERHQFLTVDEMRGVASFERALDPAAAERAGYIRTLQSWTREGETHGYDARR